MDGKPIQWNTRQGEAHIIGKTTLTPVSQALIVRFPFGGFVWNRPHSILVQDGIEQQEITVPNVTRSAQWGLMLLAGVIMLALPLVGRR